MPITLLPSRSMHVDVNLKRSQKLNAKELDSLDSFSGFCFTRRWNESQGPLHVNEATERVASLPCIQLKVRAPVMDVPLIIPDQQTTSYFQPSFISLSHPSGCFTHPCSTKKLYIFLVLFTSMRMRVRAWASLRDPCFSYSLIKIDL